MKLALYPGTFDPITLGHLDVLNRSRLIFDQVEVAVAASTTKDALFSVQDRCEMVEECVSELEGVSVRSFDGLLVDHARVRGAVALIRGLRQVSDFDYEFRMAFANRRLHPDLETVFFMTSESHAFISASMVREIYGWGGDVSSFVPAPVVKRLAERALTTR